MPTAVYPAAPPGRRRLPVGRLLQAVISANDALCSRPFRQRLPRAKRANAPPVRRGLVPLSASTASFSAGRTRRRLRQGESRNRTRPVRLLGRTLAPSQFLPARPRVRREAGSRLAPLGGRSTMSLTRQAADLPGRRISISHVRAYASARRGGPAPNGRRRAGCDLRRGALQPPGASRGPGGPADDKAGFDLRSREKSPSPASDIPATLDHSISEALMRTGRKQSHPCGRPRCAQPVRERGNQIANRRDLGLSALAGRCRASDPAAHHNPVPPVPRKRLSALSDNVSRIRISASRQFTCQ